jgi:predicted metal-dependent RNase
LAASGMLAAGRAVTWVSKLLPNDRNHIIFCGYSPANSLAGKIKEGKKKTLTIDGKLIANRCGITSLQSFSSHMQRIELLKYYSELQTEKVALVHSDMQSKIQFSRELQEEVSKKNRNYKIVAVNKSTELLL